MIIQHAIRYLLNNIEYAAVVFVLAGIITFNKTFAYIGIGNFYITEFFVAICLCSIALKWLLSGVLFRSDFLSSTGKYFLINFWPLALIMMYAFFQLHADSDFGFQALRHSMIFIYTVLFLLLFLLSIKDEGQLFFILIGLLIILSSLFNGAKIILFKILDYSFNYYEPERVFHVETDTICAALSLLGLLVYNRFFLDRSKWLFLSLVLLNIVILVLTVKRSAVFCIVPSFLLYLFLIREDLAIRTIIGWCCAGFAIAIASLAAWYLIDPVTFHQYTDYAINKFSLQEKNTSWRIAAWQLAWDRFLQSPWWGIGYGPKILQLPVNNVDTHDPHNSFLAFLVRHGMVVTIVYIFFIFRTYLVIFRTIRSSEKHSREFNNAVFVALSLTALMVFGFFNVMLENQYEGIFFNFFLSAIYIINVQKLSVARVPEVVSLKFNWAVLGIILTFVLYALSPVNKVGRIYIYSARTNNALPVLYNSDIGNLQFVSKKDVGIQISLYNDSPGAFSELLWFFPARAGKLNLSDYKVFIESNKRLDSCWYVVQYEDKTRITLEGESDGDFTYVNLSTLPKSLGDNANIQYLTILFPNCIDIRDLIIKNIYIDYVPGS